MINPHPAPARLSIVVPVYRGEQTLEALCQKIQEALEGAYDYEILLVHDCGPDQSWPVIERLHQAHPRRIRGIRLTRNYGQHNAIICGIEHASGALIITMDEDLQQDPQDIPRLIETAERTGADVVYGDPEETEHAWWRNLSSRMLKKLLRVAIPELPPYYSPFRLIRRATAAHLVQMRNSYTFLDGYLVWVTTHFARCPVAHHPRFAGRSGYTVRKLVEHSINIFVTFSNLPIRMLMHIALALFGASSIYAGWLVVQVMRNVEFQAGFPTIVVLLLLGFSLLLLGVATLGEYLYRVNIKTTKRPNYCVREACKKHNELMD
ncbi:MAG TPA: glycosyltransferase family 2 protein [Kiritimatiellia bacterium]|nr:glycosyltransferase family 2 protein [Kiritimatiellia bacterium]